MTTAQPKIALPELTLRSRAAWRRWLQRHHATSPGVWFVHFHKASGERGVSYDDCVEEALCFGWIDSTIRKLEPPRYAHLLTPRRDPGNWSPSNKARMRRLIAEGLVTPAGLAVFKPRATAPSAPTTAPASTLPKYFKDALARDPRASALYEALAPSYRRQFIAWLENAKKEETRTARLRQALRIIKAGRKSPFFS